MSSIDKHLSHASQMHIHTYTSSVYDSEPYSGIQGRCELLWTLVDPYLYIHCVDIFPHYSIYFSFLIFLPKDFITPNIINNCMTDFPHHHSIMYVIIPLYSPVICKEYFSLIYMYKLSRYYAVFHIDLGPIFPQSTTL